jgi:hypothetical protein
LPGLFWVTVFLVVTTGIAVGGGFLLLVGTGVVGTGVL